MTDKGFLYQLRGLRAMEVAKRTTFDDQALEVQRLRQQTIEAGSGTPEQKADAVLKSIRIFEYTMERPFPAQG